MQILLALLLVVLGAPTALACCDAGMRAVTAASGTAMVSTPGLTGTATTASAPGRCSPTQAAPAAPATLGQRRLPDAQPGQPINANAADERPPAYPVSGAARSRDPAGVMRESGPGLLLAVCISRT
jgi:hypothetical protein